jgi:hypothetical protein
MPWNGLKGFHRLERRERVTPDRGFRPLQGDLRIGDFEKKAPDHEHSIFMGALEWVRKVKRKGKKEKLRDRKVRHPHIVGSRDVIERFLLKFFVLFRTVRGKELVLREFKS